MISIVIPSFNQVQYLTDSIDSVLNQKRGKYSRTANFELIIIDDGSTDGSLEIAKGYLTHNPYKLKIKLISQVNKGLSSARNTGIMNAKEKYVLFLDADDILMENCLEKICQKIKETNADIIAPSFKNFGVLNHPVILADGLRAEDFKDNNKIGYFSAVKKSVLLEVGGYSPRMIWGYEDYALWIDLLKRGKSIVTIPDILVLYRTKDQSMIHEAQKHHEELMAQIKKDHPQIYE